MGPVCLYFRVSALYDVNSMSERIIHVDLGSCSNPDPSSRPRFRDRLGILQDMTNLSSSRIFDDYIGE